MCAWACVCVCALHNSHGSRPTEWKQKKDKRIKWVEIGIWADLRAESRMHAKWAIQYINTSDTAQNSNNANGQDIATSCRLYKYNTKRVSRSRADFATIFAFLLVAFFNCWVSFTSFIKHEIENELNYFHSIYLPLFGLLLFTAKLSHPPPTPT